MFKKTPAHLGLHLLRNFAFGIIIIGIALFIGMFGYHVSEHMSWIDAFINASMILSGMGPVTSLATFYGKLFAGCYALFSGLVFIITVAIIFAPIMDRFFRKIHLEINKSD